METGVDGDHGVHVPQRVIVVRGHEIDHVTIQHLQIVVPIVKETTRKRHHVLQHHVQVFVTIECFFFPLFLFLKVIFWFVLCELYIIQLCDFNDKSMLYTNYPQLDRHIGR